MSTPGPHWVKIAPHSTVRLIRTPELYGTVPAFQADPSEEPGSVRIVYVRRGGGVDLQNFRDRAISVGVIFIKPDTIQSLALFTRVLKEPNPT